MTKIVEATKEVSIPENMGAKNCTDSEDLCWYHPDKLHLFVLGGVGTELDPEQYTLDNTREVGRTSLRHTIHTSCRILSHCVTAERRIEGQGQRVITMEI